MSKIVINYPSVVDKKEYKKNHSLVTKYGLPEKIKFCSACVMTNQLLKSEVDAIP